MVTLTARAAFRLTDLNLGQIFDAPTVLRFTAVSSEVVDPFSEEGLVFEQADGSSVIFRGTGFDYPDKGRPSGHVEAIESYDDKGRLLFTVEDVSLSVRNLDRLADSYTFRDDADFWIDKFAGNDTLRLSSGDDYVSGFDGDDTIHGRAGIDQITGGAGNDELRGGAGSDVLEGGDGDDDLRGGSGRDRIEGDSGNDRLKGNADDDLLYGGSGADVLGGGTGHDHLDAGAGDDVLVGGDGFDVLIGGTGADRLNGGTGYNTLTGGTGADTFVFKDQWQVTTITDFDPTEDILRVRISGVDSIDDLSLDAEGNTVTITLAAWREVLVSDFSISDVQGSWFDFG